jgi:two-component system response regulator PilR (NtrC family)
MLLGAAHAGLKNPARAEAHFKKSIAEYEKLHGGSETSSGIESTFLEYGKFLAESNPEKAREILFMAVQSARALPPTPELQRTIRDAEGILAKLGIRVLEAGTPDSKLEKKRTAKLIAILSEVNAGGTLADTLARLSDGLLEISGAERALVASSENGEIRLLYSRNFHAEPQADPSWPAIRIILERTLASDRPMSVPNTVKSELLAEIPGVPRAIFSFPLRADEKTTGCIYLDSRFIVLGLDEDAKHALDMLASQAAAAVHKAELIEEIRGLNAKLEDKIARREKELETAKQEIEIRDRALAERHAYSNIIGKSPALAKLFDVLDKVKDSDLPVAITGESGTGKELVARAIHYNGPRARSPFVALNCAAMPEPLLESELFGHEKGAFTGAVARKIGLFESAGRGTVFLDEIPEMSAAMQAKLLRVIEGGEVRPVGSTRQIMIHSRVITAGAKNLGELVKQGRFREDLFYRLNVLSIRIPPLRERREDIPLLAEHFWRRASGGPMPERNKSAILKVLADYDWPGNVRELENEVARLQLFGGKNPDVTHLSQNIQNRHFQTQSGVMLPGLGEMKMAAIERNYMLEALRRARGNKSEAARILGIPISSIKYKMDRHGITSEEISGNPGTS